MREIMGYIDVAQVTIWLFWLFFAGLIVYLRREDRREGYPLESDTHPGTLLPREPDLLSLAQDLQALQRRQRHVADRPAPTGASLAARPTAPWPGAPLTPTGDNPMLDSIGPGSWAERADMPDMTYDNHLKIVPVRVASGYSRLAWRRSARLSTCIGADHKVAGKIVDIWVDRSECI